MAGATVQAGHSPDIGIAFHMFSKLHGAVCNGLWGNNTCGGYAISGAADQRDRMAGGSGGGGYDSSGDRSLTSDRGASYGGGVYSGMGGGSVFNGGSMGIPWGANVGS